MAIILIIQLQALGFEMAELLRLQVLNPTLTEVVF